MARRQSASPSLSLAFLQACAGGDDDRARRLLRELHGERRADEYTTANLPQRTSVRTFHEVCRSGTIAGATKTGRTWSCTREAWATARSRQPAPTLRLVHEEPSIEALADEMIANMRAGGR
jgi:hypothetical protein